MSNSDQPRRYLVCYDIAHPRRLQRVHRLVSSRAVPLQYSVFLAEMSAAALDRFLAAVDTLIKRAEDDVRVYPLPDRAPFATLGPGALPNGVIAVGPGAWNAALNGDLRSPTSGETNANPYFLATPPAIL